MIGDWRIVAARGTPAAHSSATRRRSDSRIDNRRKLESYLSLNTCEQRVDFQEYHTRSNVFLDNRKNRRLSNFRPRYLDAAKRRALQIPIRSATSFST